MPDEFCVHGILPFPADLHTAELKLRVADLSLSNLVIPVDSTAGPQNGKSATMATPLIIKGYQFATFSNIITVSSLHSLHSEQYP